RGGGEEPRVAPDVRIDYRSLAGRVRRLDRGLFALHARGGRRLLRSDDWRHPQPAPLRGLDGACGLGTRAVTAHAHFAGVMRTLAKSPSLLLPTHRPTMPRSSSPSLRTSSVGDFTGPANI